VSSGTAYRLSITTEAKRDLRKIKKKSSRSVVGRIDAKIQSLRNDPRQRGAEKLKNASPPREYRVRSGDFRILYSIDDALRTVTIGRVRDRKEAY
jgi:mRNA interferase RelE/StbE